MCCFLLPEVVLGNNLVVNSIPSKQLLKSVGVCLRTPEISETYTAFLSYNPVR